MTVIWLIMAYMKECKGYTYLATGGKVVVDSAFKIGDKGFVIKSLQQDPQNPVDILKTEMQCW